MQHWQNKHLVAMPEDEHNTEDVVGLNKNLVPDAGRTIEQRRPGPLAGMSN